MAELTRTQRAALTYLREDAQGLLWPAGRGRYAAGNVTSWSQRTLQALVDAGYAEWAPRRDGVMPHIIPTLWFEEGLRYDRTRAPEGYEVCCDSDRVRTASYICTRIKRHTGPHLAGRSDHTVAAGWGRR